MLLIDAKRTVYKLFFGIAAACLALFAAATAQTRVSPDKEVEQTLTRMSVSKEAVRVSPKPKVLALAAAVDPNAPSAALAKIADDLTKLQKRARPKAATMLGRAANNFKSANKHLFAPQPDRGQALSAIEAGIKAMAAAQKAPGGKSLSRRIDALSKDAVAVARRLAAPSVEVAGRRQTTDRARTMASSALGDGDLAVAEGNYVVAIAQFNQGYNFAADVIEFDLGTFEQNIKDAMSGQVVGYAYSIGINGEVAAEFGAGMARNSADGLIVQSPTKEMYIASMSKTLSAVALLKILDKKGISINTPIAGFLPDDWALGPNVEDITFFHLLTHRSGLSKAGTQTYADLKAGIANGTASTSDDQLSDYTNHNFSLMRILIPIIAIDPGVIQNWANVWPIEDVYAAWYAIYVKDNVLAPAGVNKSACAPSEDANSRTLLYAMSNPAASGFDPGDWTDQCGATGWYLSANELTSFLAHLRFTEDILNDDTRTMMDELFLGWLNPDEFLGFIEGDYGVYRSHGGDYPSGSVPGMTGCMMNFHINVQATLLINSRGGNLGGHACAALKKCL